HFSSWLCATLPYRSGILAARLLRFEDGENPLMTLQIDTTSYWLESASLPRFPKLERNKHAEVVVVGGGITGLTAAYLLASAGRSVILLERGRCAQIDTAHTSGHLTMVTDDRLTDLVKRFGRDHAQAVW